MNTIQTTEHKSPISRRVFFRKVAGAALASLPYIIIRPALAQSHRPLDRDAVARKLRSAIRDLLETLEDQTGLTVEFRSLQRGFGVVAQYGFEQPERPVIHLRADWEDVDAAHELMHMKLELVDGFGVLAWRKNVERDKVIQSAFGLIRSYTDDMLVFDRLAKMGLKIDGEIIKRQLFDDVCTKVPRYLRAGRMLKDDGMAHLDDVADGRFSDLRRSTFLVQAELILKNYDEKFSAEHERRLKDFIDAFREYRPPQAARADKVLAFFAEYDLASIKGHARILTEWAALEGLENSVGVSCYVRSGNGFILPYPSDCKILEQDCQV
ncbi:MAG: hypothetical protein JXN61_00610 [Sedimentisphaerales bacterium]|nr:hypothetical protein [Sedimentisphaerales bacterium]